MCKGGLCTGVLFIVGGKKREKTANTCSLLTKTIHDYHCEDYLKGGGRDYTRGSLASGGKGGLYSGGGRRRGRVIVYMGVYCISIKKQLFLLRFMSKHRLPN